MTAREFWVKKFGEEPKTDSEKLAVVMMEEYKNAEIHCSCDISTGTTTIHCCNECGLPTEEFWCKKCYSELENLMKEL